MGTNSCIRGRCLLNLHHFTLVVSLFCNKTINSNNIVKMNQSRILTVHQNLFLKILGNSDFGGYYGVGNYLRDVWTQNN